MVSKMASSKTLFGHIVMVTLLALTAVVYTGCSKNGDGDSPDNLKGSSGNNAARYPDSPAPALNGYTNCDGTPLRRCSEGDYKVSGFARTGYCKTEPTDYGTHVVCAEVTREFLDFTKSRGNDLETPNPYYRFPGLVPGDKWCLCALRWQEALDYGKAPLVVKNATQDVATNYIKKEHLDQYETSNQ